MMSLTIKIWFSIHSLPVLWTGEDFGGWSSDWSFTENETLNERDLFSDTDPRTINVPAYYTITWQPIKEIPPKHLFLSDFVAILWLLPRKKLFFTQIELVHLQFQVFHGNILLAEFKLQWVSVTLSEQTTCEMIWWKIIIFLCWVLINGTLCSILKSRIINRQLGWRSTQIEHQLCTYSLGAYLQHQSVWLCMGSSHSTSQEPLLHK